MASDTESPDLEALAEPYARRVREALTVEEQDLLHRAERVHSIRSGSWWRVPVLRDFFLDLAAGRLVAAFWLDSPHGLDPLPFVAARLHREDNTRGEAVTEVARHLGIPAGTLGQRLKRIRRYASDPDRTW